MDFSLALAVASGDILAIIILESRVLLEAPNMIGEVGARYAEEARERAAGKIV